MVKGASYAMHGSCTRSHNVTTWRLICVVRAENIATTRVCLDSIHTQYTQNGIKVWPVRQGYKMDGSFYNQWHTATGK